MAALSYSATIGKTALADFCSTWPCHGIDGRVHRIWCRWDGSGDLVELLVTYRNGRSVPPENYDGPAMLALVNDTQRQMHPEHSR